MLDIDGTPVFSNRITSIETHTYNPYANTRLGNSDEIRIPIQQQDLYTLLCESHLYIKGKLGLLEKKPEGVKEDVVLDNNCAASLFDEIRYELDGVEIDRCKNPGVTTALKNYVSLSIEKSKTLGNAGWYHKQNAAIADFNFCVPLGMLFGFCEDYKRIVINARHELILIRSRNDENALIGPTVLKLVLKLFKVQWRMPHVGLDELNKLALLHIVESGRLISMSFRSWDLYEYPLLQTTTKHTWSVKTATQLEKPRYVIFAMQTDRKNQLDKTFNHFENCKLSNIRLHLNSKSYPYDDLNLDFDKNKYVTLYDMYANFRKSYYGHGEPLLDMLEFLSCGPFAVIDCSRQNESLKSATTDVKIDFECKDNVPLNTTAYCLIIHDRIVEYSPLTNVVRRIN
ncbi:uncharacterized protein LOC128882567 [Hylaeus volcanicus]|uniref:uncharacterized protein LOC128882567 n=1 Tax=Hylaeus volcanicus TaxID=313075 RepID=UPI0023B7823C|nr:uncharacterized protein LOC128882567 [Hylaeus volcanicus]